MEDQTPSPYRSRHNLTLVDLYEGLTPPPEKMINPKNLIQDTPDNVYYRSRSVYFHLSSIHIFQHVFVI